MFSGLGLIVKTHDILKGTQPWNQWNKRYGSLEINLMSKRLVFTNNLLFSLAK